MIAVSVLSRRLSPLTEALASYETWRQLADRRPRRRVPAARRSATARAGRSGSRRLVRARRQRGRRPDRGRVPIAARITSVRSAKRREQLSRPVRGARAVIGEVPACWSHIADQYPESRYRFYQRRVAGVDCSVGGNPPPDSAPGGSQRWIIRRVTLDRGEAVTDNKPMMLYTATYDKVVKHTVDATADEITSELQEALKS